MKLNINSAHHKIFLNIIIFLSSALLITALYPVKGDFKYEFSKGKPWLHDDLIAPFDFSIHKTAQQIEAEQDSLKRNIKPYFRYDTALTRNILYDINIYVNQLKNDSNSKVVNRLLKTIKKAYKNGVFADDDLSKINYYAELIKGKFIVELQKDEIVTETALSNKILNNFGDNFSGISSLIKPNVYFDKNTTQKAIDNVKYKVSKTYGYIKKGQKIIFKGEIVDENLYRELTSLKEEFEQNAVNKQNVYFIIIGRFALVATMLWFVYLFILSYRKDIFVNTKNITFLLLLIILFVASARAVLSFDKLSIYIIPFAMIPIIIRTFFDGRLGLYISIITILLIAGMVPNSYEFAFSQISVSMSAIFTLQNINKRGKLFTTALVVIITFSVIYFASSFIQEGNWTSINFNNFVWFIGSGLLLLTAYPLIYVFERLFGFLSDITLMELSDTNQPLLRNLAEKAPGTFQHSIQVANIAEELTRKLNGNPLLARTGALYHDIGKSLNPQFFIENQQMGINPHDNIEFDKSAEIIISHVCDGVKLAKEHNLPHQIIDFIKTHHGNTKVQYFYRSFINKYPDKVPDEAKFTYPGPRPFSKETAIVMLSDSVEAATRSLKTVTEESISQMVDKIINHLIDEQQFIYTNLTFNDITLLKSLLQKKMANIYHERIEYPELKKGKA